MTTITNQGIITSFTNTAQALNDQFNLGITEDSGAVILNVMANDKGGNAKTLWSLDASGPTGLLAQDLVGVANFSKFGATIQITSDGKVSYNASTSTSLQSLAEGQFATDTFTYAIQLGNGTLSWATASVQITGTNDAPVITSAAQSGSVTEDTALTATGTVTSTDVDNGATATYSGNASGSYGSFAVTASTGVWTYTLANAAHQSLAAGETHNETFAVTVTDDKGATATQDVIVTITGTNDAPVITSMAQSGSVTEDTTLTATGTVASSDVDNGASATYSGNASSSYGSFAVAASTGVWTYTLDNAATNVQALAEGQTVTETFTVIVTDDKGATATQNVVVTITGTNEAAVQVVAAQVAPAQVVASLSSVFTDAGDPNDFDGSGSVGSQTLDGGAGSQTLYGGSGNDILSGNSSSDTLYGGSGNDILNGNNAGDTLYGGSGNDTINGGNGGDMIIGGYGADAINAGNGSDTIRYLDLKDTGDTIIGFESGTDKIDLLALDANNAAGGNQAFAWGGQQDGAFVLANSVTWYTTGGNVVVLVDTDGDLTTAEFSITLTGITSLALSDFNTL